MKFANKPAEDVHRLIARTIIAAEKINETQVLVGEEGAATIMRALDSAGYGLVKK